MSTGLRQRKKEQTRERIISCASRMFIERGYEASRIEDIAEAANLSVATFYNYFGSKADMLLASVLVETETVIRSVDACIAKPHDDLRSAFGEIVQIYFTQSFKLSSREMWREAWARTMLDPGAEFSRRYTEIDRRLAEQLQGFLAGLQSRGVIRAGVDTAALGQLLFNNVNINFIDSMRDENRPLSEFQDQIMVESGPIFLLCAPQAT